MAFSSVSTSRSGRRSPRICRLRRVVSDPPPAAPTVACLEARPAASGAANSRYSRPPACGIVQRIPRGSARLGVMLDRDGREERGDGAMTTSLAIAARGMLALAALALASAAFAQDY